jgi:methionyl-tRNA formyltransferase
MSDRVALFVCDDLVGLLILNDVIPMMRSMGLEPVLFYTGTHKNREFKNPSPDEVRFFNVELLNKTIIPFLEGQNRLGDKAISYRQLAAHEDVEIHPVADVNDPKFINSIINDDRLIGGTSERFLQVFGKEIIEVFRIKGFFWNIHSGLLPDYKGLLIPPRAIMNGETEYGLTLHDVTCGIDEGGIILKGELPVNPSKPVLDLYLDTVPLAVDMLKDALQCVLSGIPITPKIEISDKPRSYYPNPTAEEWQAFKAQGGRYIDPDTIAGRLAGHFTQAGTHAYDTLVQTIEIAAENVCVSRIPVLPHKPFQPVPSPVVMG